MLQGRSLLRPAQGGEGPQRRREPGVQHVVVLVQRIVRGQLVLFAHFGLVAAHVDLAVLVVPGWNPVAPPELPGNAPVLDVAHPLEVGVFPVPGHELDAAVFHRLDRRLGQRLDLHVPLVGEVGLDDLAGAVAARHHQLVVVDLLQQAGGFQVRDDVFAGLEAVHAAVGLRRLIVDVGLIGEDIDQRQVVALAHRVIVEIMRGRDLHAAGAEILVHVIVGDDRDFAIRQRQFDGLADQRGIALVFRVHRHRGVAQHGFRAGGGHHQMAATVGQRITQVPEAAAFLHAFDFQVGDRGFQYRVPVHQPLAAVDQVFLVEFHEDFGNRLGQALVHGEALAAPVHGLAHAANLAGDDAAGFFLPGPYALEEFLAAQAGPGFVGGRELALHHHLRGDAGVIGARLPERVVAQHPVITGQRVHDAVLEGVAHVQRASHIRRRNHDAVSVLGLGTAQFGNLVRREVTLLLPAVLPAVLHGGGVETLFHRFQ